MILEPTFTCERCFAPVAAEPGEVPPLDQRIVCGACYVAGELSAEQRRDLELSASTERGTA